MLAVAAASTGRLAAYVLAHSVDVPLGTPRSVAPGALAIHLGGYILTWQSYSDQPPYYRLGFFVPDDLQLVHEAGLMIKINTFHFHL